MRQALLDPLDQLVDRLGLIAGGGEIGYQLKGRESMRDRAALYKVVVRVPRGRGGRNLLI